MATTFESFCRHYDLDPGAEGARRDYEAYLFNLKVFQRLFVKTNPDKEMMDDRKAEIVYAN